MAVYDRSWRRYDGSITSQSWRWLVISRYALAEAFSSRAFLVYYILCAIPTPITMAFIYVANKQELLAMFNARPEALDPIMVGWFHTLFSVQASMAFFLAVIVCPSLVAPDLANNAMPLYLSRPINRVDYVLGKLAVLVLLMSPVTWVSSFLLFMFQSYLRGGSWWHENIRLLAGHVIGHATWILVIALLALAISAWVRIKFMARGLLVGQFFVLGGMGGMISLVLRTEYGNLVNLLVVIFVAVANIFDPVMRQPLPVWSAWASLCAFAALSILVLARKVKAHEVVR